MPDGRRPRVLFVGDDASSPDIAASLLRHEVGDRVEVVTAGAQPRQPGGRGDDILVQMGLDPASEERLSVRSLNVADRVVVLGTGLDVARVPGRAYEEWDVENDDLEERVHGLAVELLGGGVEPVGTGEPWRTLARFRDRVGSGASALVRRVGVRRARSLAPRVGRLVARIRRER